jgi:hypothetical protein
MSNVEDFNQALPLGYVYTLEVVDKDGKVLDSRTCTNIIPQVGVNHIVGLLRGTATPIANWYLGIYEGNFVPSSGTTAANLQTDAQECVAYSEATRPAWQHAYDGVQLVSNIANRSEFTFTAAKRIYGGFICANSAKGSNTGVLQSIARFSSPLDMPVGTIGRLAISITIIPAS